MTIQDQILDGDILVGSDSSLTLNITDSSQFTGSISGEITNAKGTTVSTELGTVDVTLDETSKWFLEADTHIESFNGTAANVITNGYTLYVNDVALEGTSESDTQSTDDSADETVVANVPAWFDDELYMENKLEQLGGNWNEQTMLQAFNKAGYIGTEGHYQHFLDWGNKENVSPNKYFDSESYFQSKLEQLERNFSDQTWTLETVRQAFEDANLSTWDHYRLYGMKEGIDPSGNFSTSDYFEAKLDELHRDYPSGNWTMDTMIAAFQQANLNPVQHYMLYGVNENLDFEPGA